MLRAAEWQFRIGKTDRLRHCLWLCVRPLGSAIIMFLLMHAQVIDDFAPFAAAFFASGLAAGASPAALVFGCLAGMIRLPLREISLISTVGCAGVLAAEILFGVVPALMRVAAETRCSLTAGFGLLLPALVFAGGRGLESLQALGCAALAAACAPFLLAASALHLGRRRIMAQEKIGAAVLAAACLAGLYALSPPLARLSGLLLVLLLPQLGASGGVILGIGLYSGGLSLVAGFALCGFVSGLNIYTRRWQRALAVLLLWVLLILLGENLTIAEAALSSAAYVLLREKWADKLRIFGENPAPDFDPARISREVNDASGRRLRALGDAFGEMAEGCAVPGELPDEQELILKMRDRLCSGCGDYGPCWAGEDNCAARFLCRLIEEAVQLADGPGGMHVLYSDGEVPPDVLRFCRRGKMIPDRLGLLLRDFAEKRRSEIKRCATGQLLSVQLLQAREILYDLAEKQSKPLYGRKTEALQAALDSAVQDEIQVSAFSGSETEIQLRRSGGWTKNDALRAGQAVKRTWGGSFVPELKGNLLVFRQKPRFFAESGCACQSGVAGQVCGDSHLLSKMEGSRLAVMLSDGMGSGHAAARESGETLRLLRSFLDAGISRSLALETVNQQMLMRTGDDIFATVDLCLIDLNSGIAEISKLAACRTLILRDGEILRIEGGRLPLGILERVQSDTKRVRLKDGDVIVMGSDGVMELGDGLMIDRIARLSAHLPPRQLAEKLVREAALRRSRGRTDDMTCICVKIGEEKVKKNSKGDCRSS